MAGQSSLGLAGAIGMGMLAAGLAAVRCQGAFAIFEAAGADVASITPTRDAFRSAVGGGTTAGANGSFGGLRREINWDGVGAAATDPNLFPANTFQARGVVFSTPGTGFLVSNNAGTAPPPLFGFPSDFQAFSQQKLFTAVNSPITDVNIFVPGTSTAATTTAFGVVFVDVEVATSTTVEFFDPSDNLIFSRNALVAGNQGLTFLGAVANAGETIGRVRITSGVNTIVSNGVLGNQVDDIVVMDDFLYAEPVAIPEPGAAFMAGLGLFVAGSRRRR